MFRIAPDITVTRKICREVFQGLPDKKHGAIWRRFKELPHNRLQVMHDLGGFGKVIEDGIEGHVVEVRIAVLGHQM